MGEKPRSRAMGVRWRLFGEPTGARVSRLVPVTGHTPEVGWREMKRARVAGHNSFDYGATKMAKSQSRVDRIIGLVSEIQAAREAAAQAQREVERLEAQLERLAPPKGKGGWSAPPAAKPETTAEKPAKAPTGLPRRIIRAFQRRGPGAEMKVADIIRSGIRASPDSIRPTLHRMVEQGRLEKAGVGVYRLAPEKGGA